MANKSTNKSLFIMLVTITILLYFSTLTFASQKHYTPIGMTRPTDPDAFWVELDLPTNFVRGQPSNFTINLYNFISTGGQGGQLSIYLASSSSSFSIPLAQPGETTWCYDTSGHQAVLMRTQSTYFDFEIRRFAAGTILPFFSFSCTFNAQEMDPSRNTSIDFFTLRRYIADGSEGTLNRDDQYLFYHPGTLNPVFNIAPIPHSVTHVQGGFEIRFLLYSNSIGTLNVGFSAIGDNIGSIQFREQVLKQYKHGGKNGNFIPLLSDDYYGRVTGLPFIDDSLSYAFINATHVANDPRPVAITNITSSSSTFCYLLSGENLIPNGETNVIDMENWSDIPLFYPRSAGWTVSGFEPFNAADLRLQLPGTHLCTVFSPTGFLGALEARIPTRNLEWSGLSPSPVTVPIKTSQLAVPRPYWYVTDSNEYSVSVKYRLPTFQRGDLIVLSKNSNNSTQFPTLPWYVDSTLTPPTPSGCIPFSLNGTHIAWIFLPSDYDTGFGSDKFSRELTCTIQLHILPGYYQQKIDLILSVIPRSFVPYYSPTAYEGVRSYGDVYKAIDVRKAVGMVVQREGLAPGFFMARILSANFGQSHFYSYPSPHLISELTVTDSLGVDFDVFKPTVAAKYTVLSNNKSNEDLFSNNENDIISNNNDQNGLGNDEENKNNKDYFLTALFNAHNSLLYLSKTKPHQGQYPPGYSVVSFDNNEGNDEVTMENDLEKTMPTNQENQKNQKNDSTMTSKEPSTTDFFTSLDDSSVTPTPTPTQLADMIPEDFNLGYRLLSLSITPLDMHISGGSLFDHHRNANPIQAFPDLLDGTSVPFDSHTSSSPYSITDYPSQPLHLVFDLDLSWLEEKNGINLSIFCYSVSNSQPIELNVAWGDPKLYMGTEDFHHRLYVQLPPTKANSVIAVRCQVPLSTEGFAYTTSSIKYYLQAGTVVELHAMGLYNDHEGTKYTSIMQRNKTVNDSQSLTGDKKLDIKAYPQKLIDDKTVVGLDGKGITFFRSPNNNPNSPPTPDPIQMLTYANVSFIVDYGVHNDDDLAQYIEGLRKVGLGDFIIASGHMNPFPSTNQKEANIPRTSPTIKIPSPLVPNSNVADSAAATRLSYEFILYLRGEIKTANANIYDHLLNMIFKVLSQSEAVLATGISLDDLRNTIALGVVLPYYGSDPYEIFPHRWMSESFYPSSVVWDFLPPLTLNGQDNSPNINNRIPTRVAVGVTWTHLPLPTSLTTGDIFLALEFQKLWNSLHSQGLTQFEYDGFQPHTSWVNTVVFAQCLYKLPEKIDDYIPMENNNDYSEANHETIVAQQRDIPCGGRCDLLCPDNYKCRRHADCYHGHCNSDGVCGAANHRNYDMVRVNTAVHPPTLIALFFVFVISFINITF